MLATRRPDPVVHRSCISNGRPNPRQKKKVRIGGRIRGSGGNGFVRPECSNVRHPLPVTVSATRPTPHLSRLLLHRTWCKMVGLHATLKFLMEENGQEASSCGKKHGVSRAAGCKTEGFHFRLDLTDDHQSPPLTSGGRNRTQSKLGNFSSGVWIDAQEGHQLPYMKAPCWCL